MHANVEDRGIKGDITPLMAAASGGYVDIVKLLLVHGADVNAQSSTGRYLSSFVRLLSFFFPRYAFQSDYIVAIFQATQL